MYNNPFLQTPVYNPLPGAQGTPTNPFTQYLSGMFQQPLKIPKVTGREGANAYDMPADSEILLLDQNDPIVWLVQTDSARLKTITPFDIALHEDEEKKAMSSIEERLSKLEEMMKKHGEPDYVDVTFTE